MPPKQAQGGAAKPASSSKPQQQRKKENAGTSNADFLKSEDVLQAVLLADSFQIKLRPLTQQKPKVSAPQRSERRVGCE